MRAIWFILKLPLKILMAYQHGGCPAGCGSSDYLLLAKRHYPAGDSISH